MMMNRVTGAVAIMAGVLATATPAFSQSMTPMLGQVRSLTNEFAIRVQPKNPYRHRIKVQVRAYDQNFRPIRALVKPSSFMLGGGSSRPVVVRVPFEGQRSRKIRICTESIPFPNKKVMMRAQVCGRFLASRAG